MEFFTLHGRVVSGDYFLTIYRPGKSFITTFAPGGATVMGKPQRCFAGELRQAIGRAEQPGAGINDSQSVKTTSTPGERGYDGAKNVKGRKLHILVNTQGLLLSVKVHPANISGWDGAKLLLEPVKAKTTLSRLKLIWADGGYNKGGLVEWVKSGLGWELEIVQHPWTGKKGIWVKKAESISSRPDAARWFCFTKAPVGSRAHLWVLWAIPTSFQGL